MMIIISNRQFMNNLNKRFLVLFCTANCFTNDMIVQWKEEMKGKLKEVKRRQIIILFSSNLFQF